MAFHTSVGEALRINSLGEVLVGSAYSVGQAGIVTAGAAQFTSNLTPTEGEGVEIFVASSGTGQIQAYDRENTNWDKLIIKGQPVELYYGNSKKFETGPAGTITVGVSTADGFSVGDDEKILVGASDDLEIYHSSGDSIITNSTGNLNIINSTNGWIRLQPKSGEEGVIVKYDGAVELYHDNSKKFETTSSGVINTGITTFSSTSHIKVPSGTTAQRPSAAVAGDFRYNSEDGQFEGYTDSWGAIAGGGGASETDTAVSSTSATSIYTTAHATNRSVSAIIQITQGTSYQVGRYLVIHDGTTATIVEESAVATGDMLGSFTADINGSNLRILVNMASASSATVTILPTVVTV
ncbi:MAG: hypothetical protein CM15mV24_0020 [Bellamyvirus sp.]|nr:MAG: hypothetical protein CM15mV24_0020 [Bellamyvirus sp.]